ncbi:RHO GTPase-activating protein RGD1 [Cytospora mali]|uniref:RHO GTPase-activating protein RGD1 n=1 Tax=Cytospora mali TaxID=578113 RepID=A0A194V146_CYTMA|nr:RHO GTPase-activating protein RGD1 [Valsa mali var. pyri (nom. inval.)]
MADANASTDYLPQNTRDRADSTMSLGAGITLTDNDYPNGAGTLSSPTGPPATTTPAPPANIQSGDEKQVQDVLTSEIGVATMLNRLKQSVASAKEFGNFLKKRAAIEEDNASGLKRLARNTSDNMRRSDHLGGSFARAFEGMMGTHDRIAENGMQYATSLIQMAEDLNELASVAEKQRKSWKQNGLAAEQRVADVEAQMRKSHSKYYSLAEEYDRARTGDGSKGGKMFGFKGPKSAAQHEEELLRKVQAADQDYQSKVQTLQQERNQLIMTTRPEAIRALQDIVQECDSGLVLQMQKFASFNEKLLLSNGLSVSPLKNGKGPSPVSMSLREIVSHVDTQKDLSDYLCANHNRVPPNKGEPKYERHPVLGGSAGGTTVSSGPLHNQPARTQPPSQGLGQPVGHARQDSASQPTSPPSQPPQSQQQPPSSQDPDWQTRTPMSMMPPAPKPASSNQQHERSFSSASMLNQSGPTATQQYNSNRNSLSPGMLLQGGTNNRFNGNTGSMASQGPPQLGALAFQEPTQPPQLPPFPMDAPAPALAPALAPAPQQQYQPSLALMGPGQGQGPSPNRAIGSRPVFGVSLARLYERDGLAVPMVVYQCIQAVDLFGLTVEGIYRLSGSLPSVNKLKSMFDTDTESPQLDFRNPENFFHDVNSVAGLLKQFFRDLPDPLLTKEHYTAFIEAAKHEDDTVRRDSLHAIINSLPDPNYATLRAVALHLFRVMDNSATNRMTSQNLAIVFGPTLMGGSTHGNISDSGFQCKVVDTILQNTYQIFDDD